MSFGLAVMIASFSVKHKSHRLEMLLYGLARLIIVHLMLKSLLLSRRFQMYLDNSVLFVYFLCLNVSLCCEYRCLKVPSVSPM